jgi:hypothetical protein
LLLGVGGAGPEYFYFPGCDFGKKRVVDIHIPYGIGLDEIHFSLELKDSKANMSAVIPYYYNELCKKNPNHQSGVILYKEPNYLQSKSNYCPKCEKFTLEFKEVGLWD